MNKQKYSKTNNINERYLNKLCSSACNEMTKDGRYNALGEFGIVVNGKYNDINDSYKDDIDDSYEEDLYSKVNKVNDNVNEHIINRRKDIDTKIITLIN